MELGLANKVVVVTGAAIGIGAEIAAAFAAEQSRVALVDHDESGLERVAENLTATGAEVRPYLCDIRDVAAVRDVAARIESELGVPAVLVNNAAWTATVPFLEATEEQFERTLDTCLKGLFFLSQSIARQMVAAASPGSIVHLGSQLGVAAFRGRSVYGAAKGGVHQLTRVMALELGSHGIRVNAVAPCITETATRRNLLDDPEYVEFAMSKLVLGRWAQPGDIVGPVLFVASEKARMMTGHVLMVDGGWTIH